MADTIKVPFIDKPLPKPAVYIGLGVTGLLIVSYYRKPKNTAAPAPGIGLASGTDTGVLSGDTSTQGTPGTPGQIGQNGPPFATNEQWSAYAIGQLGQITQFDGGATAEALGLYLNGRELTVNQEDIVYAAIGVAGPVPVRAPSGYPPNLRLKPTKGKPRGGKTFAQNPVAGLRFTKKYPTQLDVAWDRSDHATSYLVSLTDESSHRSRHSVTTAKTSHDFSGLRPVNNYRVTVLARPAEKGDRPAEIETRTPLR